MAAADGTPLLSMKKWRLSRAEMPRLPCTRRPGGVRASVGAGSALAMMKMSIKDFHSPGFVRLYRRRNSITCARFSRNGQAEAAKEISAQDLEKRLLPPKQSVIPYATAL
eukprot:2420151-Pleurochrysis_carterae.AAC.3